MRLGFNFRTVGPLNGHGGTPAAPVKMGNPTISGTPQVGQTLTATHGVYSGAVTGYFGQWFSGASAISLATALTYVPQSSDLGNDITYEEYASNAVGSSATGTSNAIGPIVSASATLGTLGLSLTTFTVGTPSSGTITGATVGSTISASGLPTGLTINGAARTWAYDGTGSATTGSFTLTETLAGATNTPHTSTISYTINAAAGSFATPTLAASSAAGTAPLVLEWSYPGTDDIVGLYGQLQVATDNTFATIEQDIVFFIDGDSWARLDEAIGLLTPSGAFSTRIRVCRDNDSGATTVTGTDPQGNAVSFTADVSAWSNVYSDTIAVSVAVLDAAHKESHVALSGNPVLTATMPISWGSPSGVRASIQQVNNDGYFECTWTLGTGSNKKIFVAIVDGTYPISTAGGKPGNSSALGCSYNNDGDIFHDSTFSNASGWTAGDKIGVRLNKTTKVVTFYKNGVAQSPTVTLSSCTTFYGAVLVQDNGDTITANFGASAFSFLPSGANMYG